MKITVANRYGFLIALTLLVLVGIFLYPFWVSLMAGLIFAMVLSPLMKPIKRRWLSSRRLRAGIFTFLFAAAFLVPLGFGVYFGTDAGLIELKRIQEIDKLEIAGPKAKETQTFSKVWINRNPSTREWLKRIPISETRLLGLMDDGIAYVTEKATLLAQKIFREIPNFVISSIIVLFTMFFVLADGYKTLSWRTFNPIFDPEESIAIMQTFQQASISVVRAAVVSGICQSTVLLIASLVSGKGSPMIIMAVTFFCSFVPVIGTFPVTASLVLFQFLSGNVNAALIFLIFGMIASIVDNIVYPSVLGGHTRLHPLVAFVTAFGALEMIGVYGVFIGPVITATLFKIISIQDKANIHEISPSTQEKRAS